MRDGTYVVGMVSKSVHSVTHRAALQREGFIVRDLGGSNAETTTDMDIVVVRSQSCSHNASAQAYAWARRDSKNRKLIASNSVEDIVRQAKEWREQQGKEEVTEEVEDKEEASAYEAEQKVAAALAVTQILDVLGFFSLRMVKREEDTFQLAERHLFADLLAEKRDAVSEAFDTIRKMGQRHVIRYLRGLYDQHLRQSPTSVFPLNVPTTDQIVISLSDDFYEYWSDTANRKELMCLTLLKQPATAPTSETTPAPAPEPVTAPIPAPEPTPQPTEVPVVQTAPHPVTTSAPVFAPSAPSSDPLLDFKAALKHLLPFMEKAGVSKLTIDNGQVSLVRSLVVDGVVKAQE